MRATRAGAARLRGSLLLLAMAAGAGGCVTHVGHGPRIEPGTHWNVTSSVSFTADDFQADRFGFMPSVWAGFAHGWTRGEDGPALSLGAQVPLLFLPYALLRPNDAEVFAWLLAGDLYVQPRRAPAGGIDYGAGVLASRTLAMPYVQIGRVGDGGFYTTQGVAFTYGDLNREWYWMPSVSVRAERPDGRRAVDFYLGGLLGFRDRPTGIGRSERVTEWLVTLGAMAEIRRRE